MLDMLWTADLAIAVSSTVRFEVLYEFRGNDGLTL
jgi:hypothetical protein